jgi:hypothetical protein
VLPATAEEAAAKKANLLADLEIICKQIQRQEARDRATFEDQLAERERYIEHRIRRLHHIRHSRYGSVMVHKISIPLTLNLSCSRIVERAEDIQRKIEMTTDQLVEGLHTRRHHAEDFIMKTEKFARQSAPRMERLLVSAQYERANALLATSTYAHHAAAKVKEVGKRSAPAPVKARRASTSQRQAQAVRDPPPRPTNARRGVRVRFCLFRGVRCVHHPANARHLAQPPGPPRVMIRCGWCSRKNARDKSVTVPAASRWAEKRLEKHRFCSYECAKEWVSVHTPPIQRHEINTIIDITSGRAVGLIPKETFNWEYSITSSS